MTEFNKLYNELLTELNIAGDGGVFGSADSMGHGGSLTPSSDFYAPGDARNIFGGVKRKKKRKKRARKKHKKKRIKKEDTIAPTIGPVQTRGRVERMFGFN